MVAVLAYLMRGSREERAEERPSPATEVDLLLAEVSGADPETAGEAAAVSSDGWTFVPADDEVDLIPPSSPEPGMAATRGHFDVGELIGARVRRGAPSFDPWRL